MREAQRRSGFMTSRPKQALGRWLERSGQAKGAFHKPIPRTNGKTRKHQQRAGSFANDYSWLGAFPEKGCDHGVDDDLRIIRPGFVEGAIHLDQSGAVVALLLWQRRKLASRIARDVEKIPVFMAPGSIRITFMPYCANSKRMASLSEASADFDAAIGP